MLQDPAGERGVADGTGPMPPVGSTDPGGLQTAGTGAAALAVVTLAASGSGNGDALSSALGWAFHSSQVATAGLSFASLGRLSLFAVGLILVALSFLLNVASLVIRWQNRYAVADACEKEIERRARRYADRLYRASAQGSQPPLSTGSPSHPPG
jgi:hypothetical protein